MKIYLLLLGLLLVSIVSKCDSNNTDTKNLSERINDILEQVSDQFNSLKDNISKTIGSKFKRQNRNPRKFNPHIGLQSSQASRDIDQVSSAALGVSRNIKSGAKSFDRISSLKAPRDFCPFKEVHGCDVNSRFRTFDGSCNNVENPWWGKAEIPYKRYLPADYADGLQQPRVFAKSRNELPNPRLVSRILSGDNKQTENLYSHLLALFGQFTAHDVTSVAITTDERGAILNCPCGSPNPSCFSMVIPQGEQIMQTTCMTFTRSSAAFPTVDCRLGVREQLNILSSFIDGTQIYGFSEQRASDLRTHHGGQMGSTPGVNGRPFLLQGIDSSCSDTSATVRCFVGGEGRANENLALTSIHTLFMREHNKIAQELASIRPDWNDETLYQETRRIVLAILQHITYREFLPAILGFNTVAMFDLLPLETDTYYGGYDTTVNPTIANEFAAGAFRFGHTLINQIFTRTNGQNQKVGQCPLSRMLFRPVEAYNAKEGGLDSILLGLINDPAGKYDTSFADALQNHLFEFKQLDGKRIAVDLAATNINRGRDHGLPSYNAYRQKCGFPRAATFNDLTDLISKEQVDRLASVYESPDDIDLYIGGLSETPAVGAVVGPVFSCLIASQFNDLKKGDRFYYENGPSNTAFSLNQLHEIRKISFSRLICDNTDVQQIQPNAFLMPLDSINNAKVSCAMIPQMDLRAWASTNQ